jgi:N-acetylmuramoyl-L-alanine amidase
MFWLLSFLVIFHSFAQEEYIPNGLVVTKDISQKIDLETILERIAEIDASSKLNRLIDNVLAQDKTSVQKRKSKIVIIDAGHGGKDPGTRGIMGTVEKDLVMQYSLLLSKVLRDAGYTVILTRNGDSYLSLIQRRKFAQNHNGSLMISLHADSAETIDARGLSIYTLSNEATDEVAKMLAETHDASDDIIFRSSVRDNLAKTVLIDVAQRATISRSEYFASILIKNAEKSRLFVIPRPHRRAGFAVLKMPDVPSVLIELGFLSNPEEEILLRSPAYRNQIIQTVFKSIDEFCGVGVK